MAIPKSTRIKQGIAPLFDEALPVLLRTGLNFPILSLGYHLGHPYYLERNEYSRTRTLEAAE